MLHWCLSLVPYSIIKWKYKASCGSGAPTVLCEMRRLFIVNLGSPACVMKIVKDLYSCLTIEKGGDAILCGTCEHIKTSDRNRTTTTTSPIRIPSSGSLASHCKFIIWIPVNKWMFYRFSRNEPIFHMQEDRPTVFPDPPCASVTCWMEGLPLWTEQEGPALVEVRGHPAASDRLSVLMELSYVCDIQCSHCQPCAATEDWEDINVIEDLKTLFCWNEFKCK